VQFVVQPYGLPWCDRYLAMAIAARAPDRLVILPDPLKAQRAA
jgi:hypothetical protein